MWALLREAKPYLSALQEFLMLVGLVGAPNSGKSTFFRAATLSPAEVASYPFTTIKPNQGVGYLTAECPCRRLGVKCDPQNSRCESGTRMIPVKLLDVAGLVPDAHKGKGMGNQFLNDLTQASGLIHVLDASGKTNSEGKPDSWDPKKTVEMLEYEVDEWLRDIIEKSYQKCRKTAEATKAPLERMMAQKLSGLGIGEDDIKSAMREHGPEEHGFATALRRISKPIIIAANKADLPEAQGNLEALKGPDTIPCSAESELALREAGRHGLVSYLPGSGGFEVRGEPSEKQSSALEFIRKFLERYGSTGVQACLNKLVFEKLGMIVVYPVASMGKLSDNQGRVLPDAHLVPKGTTLRELAARVHTTMAEAFIGGLDIEKKKIGADYELRDGDVVEILFKG
jgi:ribosome-binding ATPase YchF (GTP1/OBG family)